MSFSGMKSRREEDDGSVHLCGVDRFRGSRKRQKREDGGLPAPSSGIPDILRLLERNEGLWESVAGDALWWFEERLRLQTLAWLRRA